MFQPTDLMNTAVISSLIAVTAAFAADTSSEFASRVVVPDEACTVSGPFHDRQRAPSEQVLDRLCDRIRNRPNLTDTEDKNPVPRQARSEQNRAISPISVLSANQITLNETLPKVGSPDTYPIIFGQPDGQAVVLAREDFRLRALYSADGGASFQPEVDVTTHQVLSVHGELAVDGTLYVAYQHPLQGGSGISMTRSSDMGQTWSLPTTVVGEGDPTFPIGQVWRLVANDQGAVALAYFASDGAYTTVSSDHGQTWSASQFLMSGGWAGLMDLAIDAAVPPTVYVVYEAEYLEPTWGSTTRPYLTATSDYGQTYSPPRYLAELTPAVEVDGFLSDIHIAPDSSLLVGLNYFDWLAGETIVVAARSIDGGGSFVGSLDQVYPTRLFSFVGRPEHVSYPGSSTVLLYYIEPTMQMTVHRSADNGATFGPPQFLCGETAVRGGFFGDRKRMTRTPTGGWAIVWMDDRNLSSHRQTEVFYSSSSNDGLSWTPGQSLQTATPGPGDSREPEIAAVAGDEVLVVYEDTRITNGDSADLYANRIQLSTLVVGPDARIDQDAGQANAEVGSDISIATNGAGHAYVSFTTTSASVYKELFLAISDDNGYTYGPPTRITFGANFGQEVAWPAIAATSDGRVYLVYYALSPGATAPEVRLKSSADFGTSWSPPVVLGGLKSMRHEPIKIAAEPGGSVYVQWVDDNNGNLLFARSLDGGQSFQVSEIAPGSLITDDALCVQGSNVFIGFKEGSQVWAVQSTDGGAVFSTRADINQSTYSASGSYLKIDCAPGGNAVLAWRASGARIVSNRFAGGTWTAPTPVDDIVDYTIRDPAVAYSDNVGSQLVIAHAGEGTDGRGALFAAYSANGGATFDPVQELDASISGAVVSGYDVRIASDRQGNVWVSWLGGTGSSSVLVSHSADGGASFGSPRRVDQRDPQGNFYNDIERNTLSASTPGAALIAWAGQNDSSHMSALVNAHDVNDPDRDTLDNSQDNCPTIYNPTQQPVPFPANVVAVDGNQLTWGVTEDVDFVKGPISGFATYATTGGGLLTDSSGLDISADVPTNAEGFYYVFRLAAPCGSWQTELGANPGRDSALP